jgi:hypothetical protein
MNRREVYLMERSEIKTGIASVSTSRVGMTVWVSGRATIKMAPSLPERFLVPWYWEL